MATSWKINGNDRKISVKENREMKEIDFTEQIVKWREEQEAAMSKKQYEKIDTKELKRDDKKEKKEHEKDALEDDDSKIKKLKKGKPSEKKSVEVHDIKKDEKYDKKKLKEMKSAVLSTKNKNDLPDSDFAYIEPGGEKDSEGKTVPRSLRHLPINDAAHVRNALARLNQTKISEEAIIAALKKIKAAAKKFGIKVSEASASIDYSELY